jgi:polyhydroxybutyrate depolymerase
MAARGFVGVAIALVVVACASCGGSGDDAGAGAAGAGGEAGSDAAGGAGAGGSGAGGTAGASGSGGTDGGGSLDAGTEAGSDAAAGACAGLPGTAGDSTMTVSSGGEQRTVHLHVPASYASDTPTMLVLAFHGWTENGTQFEDISQLSPVADAHGFIVAYPDGDAGSWNAGTCCPNPPGSHADDVQFARDMIDALSAAYCIDPKRVYAAGFSNGGMLSQRIACEASDRFAAIGPVAGPFAIDPATCTPSRPMPIMETHGTADFVVPWAGGGLSNTQSVDVTIARWVTLDGCTDAQPATVLQNGDVTCTEHSQCQGGAAVRLCTVQNGGHQWPGGHSAGPLGNLSTSMNTGEELYAFFAAHPLP